MIEKMYRSSLFSAILFLSLFCVNANSNAFCPVSILPGNLTCEGQGELKWTAPYFPKDVVGSNGQLVLRVSGGCPPYSWAVEGNGYWLENDLTFDGENIVYTDSNIACVATIAVSDKYGNQVTGNVRAPGRWVLIGNDCLIPGPKTRKLRTNFWERVEGRYKQTQGYSYDYWNGTCLYKEPPCGNQAYCCIPARDPGIECISLESTGMIDGYDRRAFPCFWQSPQKWSEVNKSTNHSYCKKRRGMGWTSMACFKAELIRLYEWRCE